MNKIDLLKTNNVEVENSLELWGNMESYNESLKEFKDTLNTKITNLENYKNIHDWNNYAILAHSMKSELKYLGFMKDSEIFLAHELKGKENNGEFIINNFNSLRETARKINALLTTYFSEEENIENKKNILIADDSNIILNFLEKNIIQEEYKILKAKDGKETISILESNNIYAILLDLNMPGTDGFEVLKYLKEHDLIEKIPVVIITGDDTQETIEKAFTYPILDVLNKPFNEKSIERIFTSIKGFYENQ